MGTRPCQTKAARAWARRLASTAIVASAAMAAAPGHAQSSDDAAGRAQAVIQASVNFMTQQNLSFGTIVPGGTGGTVTISPYGVRTHTGDVTPVGGGYHAALFAGRGRRNQMMELHFGSGSIWLTGPGAPMRVDLFEIGDDGTFIRDNRPNRYKITTRDGTFQFPVGARLNVGPNQRAGYYVGTFTLTVDFQ